MKKYIYLILSLFLFCSQSYSQNTDSRTRRNSVKDGFSTQDKTDSTSTNTEDESFFEMDYENIKLPPVNVFLEAAESYASVKYYDAKREEQSQLLKISQKEWLKYFRIQANYQYGTNNAYMVESGQYVPMDKFTTNTQNWYNIGVVLSIPLDDVFSRSNKNKSVRAQLAQTEFEQARSLEERQIIILEAYNEVIKNLALLKVNAESVALYDAQMRISEKDFENGAIDIISLSLERGRRTEANIKYQTSRAALHNAVTILEMLTKIKIIK